MDRYPIYALGKMNAMGDDGNNSMRRSQMTTFRCKINITDSWLAFYDSTQQTTGNDVGHGVPDAGPVAQLTGRGLGKPIVTQTAQMIFKVYC